MITIEGFKVDTARSTRVGFDLDRFMGALGPPGRRYTAAEIAEVLTASNGLAATFQVVVGPESA